MIDSKMELIDAIYLRTKLACACIDKKELEDLMKFDVVRVNRDIISCDDRDRAYIDFVDLIQCMFCLLESDNDSFLNLKRKDLLLDQVYENLIKFQKNRGVIQG